MAIKLSKGDSFVRGKEAIISLSEYSDNDLLIMASFPGLIKRTLVFGNSPYSYDVL